MDQIPLWASAVLGAWLTLGLAVYFSLLRLVTTKGGKVSAGEFGQPDFLLCGGFILWFSTTIISGFGAPEHAVTRKDIINSGVLYVGIMALIAVFMRFHGLNPLRQFGILRRNPLLCVAMAAGLLAAAYPLVMAAGRLTEFALNGRARPQNIVQYFMNASEGSDNGAILLTMALGVVVAPAAEETIFRGYIYGVLKRYAGGPGAAVISAGLFAAAHLSLSSFPALFLLALCFTLAYEATGSLLVNIFMHSLFNLWNFVVVLMVSHYSGAS